MALSVLIIEDEIIIGLLLGDVLADLGYKVCAIATTAAEAFAAAATHSPDLMIVDVNLGRESGISAADAICAVSAIPCIFVSGDDAILKTLTARGEVLPKPYQRQHLERAIAATLGARRSPARGLG